MATQKIRMATRETAGTSGLDLTTEPAPACNRRDAMSDKTTVIRKTFTLTERDIQVIRDAVKKCGFVSDSEALRAILRFYAEHAPCMSQTASSR